MKLETLEIIVEDILIEEKDGNDGLRLNKWGLKDESMRILEISEGIEGMRGIMELVAREEWSPRRELSLPSLPGGSNCHFDSDMVYLTTVVTD
jgi:hypothetical protein